MRKVYIRSYDPWYGRMIYGPFKRSEIPKRLTDAFGRYLRDGGTVHAVRLTAKDVKAETLVPRSDWIKVVKVFNRYDRLMRPSLMRRVVRGVNPLAPWR